MKVRNEEVLSRLLDIPPGAKEAVLEIAQRLESLKEYNREQALFVATDIVRCRLGLGPISEAKKTVS